MIKQKGFTLIELLVVIAVVGALSSAVVFSFNGSQKKARDAGRKNDIGQYRNAIEAYANSSNGVYLTHTTATLANTLCGASELNLSVACPTDVKTGTAPYGYYYLSDASALKYVFYAYLEGSTNYWGLCSNGTTISKATAPVIGDCP